MNLTPFKFFAPLLALSMLFCFCKGTAPPEEIRIVQTFTGVPCYTDRLDEYDEMYQIVPDENGEMPEADSSNYAKKTRGAFKPCRTKVYTAIYKDENGNVITNNRIKTVTTGQRWEHQPEKQDELNIQYEYYEGDQERAASHELNSGIAGRMWQSESVTGVIENVQKVWMHPFRSNQYTFTEVAPFPEVLLPLSIGKQWEGRLSMGQGWGDWEGMTVDQSYEVDTVGILDLPSMRLDSCWKIASVGTFDLGDSYLDFWFHKDFGFVQFEYSNYGGKTLSIVLSQVIEPQ